MISLAGGVGVPTKVYIFFTKSYIWWGIFLKPGFSHVGIALTIDGDDKKIFGVEALDCGLRMAVIDGDTGASWKERLISKMGKLRILEVEYNVNEKQKMFSWLTCRWGIFSCVTIPNYILNISPVAWTPYGLFKKLQNKRFLKKNPHILSVKVIKGGKNGR